MSNFWKSLSKPIFALAPMEDVTDTVFREIIADVAEIDHLHVIYSEFTSVDGMNHPVGKLRVGERLIINESEKNILKKKNIKLVAQVWGKRPELFYKIAKEITEEYDFDGLDVNMGCPVKNVIKNGCCSALIDQPSLAKEIIQATKEGTHLPVSVKTRTGIRIHDTERWITDLLETDPAAIILHGRTQKQQSDGLSDWDEIAKAARLRDRLKPEIPFLGNGDIMSYEQGLEYAEKYQIDGVMIGRGIFHNPWFFTSEKKESGKQEKLQLLVKHTKLYEKTWAGGKNFNILKRFYKIYTSDFPEAAKLRARLMEANSYLDVYSIIGEELAKSG